MINAMEGNTNITHSQMNTLFQVYNDIVLNEILPYLSDLSTMSLSLTSTHMLQLLMRDMCARRARWARKSILEEILDKTMILRDDIWYYTNDSYGNCPLIDSDRYKITRVHHKNMRIYSADFLLEYPVLRGTIQSYIVKNNVYGYWIIVRKDLYSTIH